METFAFCAIEKPSTDFHNILETFALFYRNFIERRFNIVSFVLLQPEIIKQSTYFSPVYIFVRNFHDADFELYVNPEEPNTQHLFRLSGIGEMPLHKCRNTICCTLRDQGGKGGGMRFVRFQEFSSKRATTIGIALAYDS